VGFLAGGFAQSASIDLEKTSSLASRPSVRSLGLCGSKHRRIVLDESGKLTHLMD
jgi:hypothetical protein